MGEVTFEAPRDFLIRKGGYYYRPNAQGYTANVQEAGRFTFSEAWDYSHPNGEDGPRDGITFIHESEVDDSAAEALTTAQAEIEALRKALGEISRYTGDDAGHLVCIALRALSGSQT